METTLYIIAYDIPDTKRRSKIHKILCGYGQWTQYSLFECWLNRRQLIELQAKLQQHLIERTDSLRLYPLCASCQPKVVTIGSSSPHDPASIIL